MRCARCEITGPVFQLASNPPRHSMVCNDHVLCVHWPSRLHAACRIGWYLNNQYVRASLSSAKAALLPTGTTSNEALHAELNNTFRQVVRLHRSTLLVKLRVFHVAKLVAHTTALASPTLRQNPQGVLLARALATYFLPVAGWLLACEQRSSGPLRRARLGLDQHRAVDRDRARKWRKFHSISRAPSSYPKKRAVHPDEAALLQHARRAVAPLMCAALYMGLPTVDRRWANTAFRA